MTTSLFREALPVGTDDVRQVEQVVSMPIVNPATGGKSRKFRFVGKLDLRDGGQIVDYKGVSDCQRFIDEQLITFQAELYAMASGGHVHEIEYRLITRPTRKYITPTHKWAVMRAGRKTAVRVFEIESEAQAFAKAQGCGVAKRTNGYETRQAYEDACLEWLLEKPVLNRQLPRLVSHTASLSSGALAQTKQFLWNCAQRVLYCRRTEQWLPNGRACYGYNKRCQFADVCQAIKARADWQWMLDDQFHVTDNPHPELGDDGRDMGILTHSAIVVLASCELKYWLLYERCYRAGQEDSEPLWVGNAMHAGLAAYHSDSRTSALDAYEAIDTWADNNPVLGEDANWRQEQQVARARAMVRAASRKWPTPPAE